jgi:glutamyl/glutaminyl-tRNA synthetase
MVISSGVEPALLAGICGLIGWHPKHAIHTRHHEVGQGSTARASQTKRNLDFKVMRAKPKPTANRDLLNYRLLRRRGHRPGRTCITPARPFADLGHGQITRLGTRQPDRDFGLAQVKR